MEAATNLLKLKKLTVEQTSSTIGIHLEQVIELKKQIRMMHDFAASNADEIYYDELARRINHVLARSEATQ